uniref:Uncharacterized protein n=1 Tax=Opuntia streptacantha TaxID=393608 RepID=A0A7C8YIM5_OPUST
MFLCKLLTFLLAYSPSMGEVTFISHKCDCHVGICMLLGILKPRRQMVKGFSPGYVIHKKCPCCSSVIRSSDGSKGFLSCSVPNLKLNGPSLNGDHPGTEFDTDSQIMHRLKSLVGELQQQA